MARLPRFVLPGFPQHVIQRGTHHQRILRDEEDYWFLWGRLCDAAAKFDCDIHAYVLMPNHFHLLLTPWRDDGIGKLMQYTGRYFVQYFNHRYGRAGTLWEGRYRATLLDPETLLLPVSRYIESNPVRAAFVEQADDYDWSSHAANALGIEDELTTPHPVYRALGDTAADRQQSYRARFDAGLSQALIEQIRAATNKAWVLGDERFCQAIKHRLNRRARPLARGGDRRSAAYRRTLRQAATLH
ncbi:MAG: transposase [Halochromatium sp.]|uniref:transposase n=1 Tax=Halochromatium sp. TaxID=2049430 RepID=UPI00397C41BA